MNAASLLSAIDNADDTKLASGLKAQEHLDALDVEWFAERLHFERDGLRVVVDRRPGAIYDPDGNLIGFDLYIRAYRRNGREYRLDPHRRFINPPLVLANTREINALASCEEILFDSIKRQRNKRGWRTSGTVTTVFAAANQWGQAASATYATARALGAAYGGDAATAFRLVIGQYVSGGTYLCIETAIGFDVSAITDASINKVDLMMFGNSDASTTDFNVQVSEHDYGASPTGAPMVSGATCATLPVLASWNTSGYAAAYLTFTEQADLLQKSVQRFAGLGTVKYVMYSDRMAANIAPPNFEYVQFSSVETAGTTSDPKLVITSSAVYHVPAGLIIAWLSTNASIPAGWSRVTALDSKFPKGSTTAAATGGADTHTHPDTAHQHTDSHGHVTVTSGARAGGAAANIAGVGTTPDQAHTHAVVFDAGTTTSNASTAGTSSSGGNLPTYYQVIWIKSDGTTDIPTGCVAFWGGATTTIPTNWQWSDGTNSTVNLKTTFLRGAAAGANAAAGVTATNHTHTSAHTHPAISHTHTTVAGSASPTRNVAGAGAVAREPIAGHHSTQATYNATSSALASDATASANALPEPAYTKLHHIWKTGSSAVLPIGLIAMWDGPAASIPPDWAQCDGAGGRPQINGGSNHFVKGSTVNGDQGGTGGTATHTHTLGHTHGPDAHTHTNAAGISGSVTSAVFNGTVSSSLNQSHTHTAPTSGVATGTTSNAFNDLKANTSNDPAFYSVLFIQRVSINTTVTPTVAALVTNLFAPTVTVGAGNVTATPSTAALVTATFAPTVNTPRRVEPSTLALVTTPFAPIVSTPRLVTPGVGSLVTALFPPDISIGVRASPSTAALVLTTFAPAVLTPVYVAPQTASLALTPSAPNVFTPVLITPTAGALVTATFAPSVVTPVRVEPPTAALTLVTFAPAVATPRLVVPSAGALLLTTYAPNVSTPRRVEPITAALVLNTFAPYVFAPRLVTPATAALALATFAPNVYTPRQAVPITVLLVTTLFPPGVQIDRRVVVGGASLVTVRFAPIVLTPRAVVPITAALTLTTFPPDIDVTLKIIVPTAHLITKRFLAIVRATDVPMYTPGGYWPPRKTTTLWGIEEANLFERSDTV